MARTIREARLGTPTARSRLKAGRMPHWNTIAAGREHLGWQRWPRERAGRWLLRQRRGGVYSAETIGIADDETAADGVSVLTYEQARAKAIELSQGGERAAGRITVSRAVADYIDHLRAVGKSTRDAESAAVTHILPRLGDVEVASLTSTQLRKWLGDLASTSARRRTRSGEAQKFKAAPRSEEDVRRRRSSANRVFTVLRAALNLAFDEKRVASNEAWGRRVKPFRGVDAARARYLNTDEAVRLLNACDLNFRSLVRAALETGMRYSELARLEVADFNPDAGAINVRRSKSGRARHVVLTKEGAEFFGRLCAGRRGGERMLLREGKQPWGPSNQGRLIVEANLRAGIDPPITFHGLRHTWASLAVMNGVPMIVIAQNLGHADTRMVERHYGHLADDFITAEIRRGAPRFGAVQASNVEPFKIKRDR